MTNSYDDIFNGWVSNEVIIPAATPTKKHKSKASKRSKVDMPANEYALRPAQTYQGFEMIFLKNPRIYIFKHSVMMAEAKFNYRVSKINDVDVNAINGHLAKMNKKLEIVGNDAYMNCRNIKFLNDAFPDEEIDFNDALCWKLMIQIQGYKTSTDGILSPIWKILEAHQTI